LALVRYLKARKTYADKRGVSSSRLWLGQWASPHRYRHTYAHNWKLSQGSTEGLMATGGCSARLATGPLVVRTQAASVVVSAAQGSQRTRMIPPPSVAW
jgi:hypothetical protein